MVVHFRSPASSARDSLHNKNRCNEKWRCHWAIQSHSISASHACQSRTFTPVAGDRSTSSPPRHHRPPPPPPLLLPSIRFCFSHSFRRLAGVPTVVAVIALFTGFRSWFSLFFFCFGCERLRSSCNTYSIWIGNCYAFHFYGDHFVHSVHIDWFHLLLLLHDSFVMLKEVTMNGNNRMIISMISTYV